MQRGQTGGGVATVEAHVVTRTPAEEASQEAGRAERALDVDVGRRAPARASRSATRSTARSKASERPYCPKISIIMATYRRQHTIYRTVNRIVAQTYPNWELIVVDNARSGDYHFDDPRIRVYRHAARASASYARNEGVRYATGDLVLFFDDDDDMFPTYLEQFVAAFREHPDAKLVRCGAGGANEQDDGAYATPECCVRREFITPTWANVGYQGGRYFSDIIAANGWSQDQGDIVVVREQLYRANGDRRGGLRSGRP